MKQECRIWNVWMLWLAIPGIALVLGLLQGWWAAVVVIVAGTAFQLAYVRWFPHVSRWLGYGSVADVPAQVSTHEAVPRQVTLYTARGCPFCPIIRQRIAALRGDLGFELVERDVTFQPRLLAAKGIQSVPVVQAGGQFLAGNATSAELAAFLGTSRG